MSLETEPITGMDAGGISPGPARLSRGTWMAAAAAALLQLVLAVPFLQVQSIWSDETTQIAGLTLPPIEAARWLAGEDPGRFGVSADRMPPLSYWMGWAWARAFGPSERSYRWMGLVASACATGLVALTAGRLAGTRGAVASGLLFALSPNIMTMAPEIRAYPLYLTFSAAATLALIGYVQSRREHEALWLVACLASSLAAIYTHFFGLVLGGAVFTSATVVALLGRRRVALPILGGVAMVALSAGILPFALASSAISSENRTDTPAQVLGTFAKMCYRLIGHPAATVDRPAVALLLAGMVGLIALGLLPRRSVASQESDSPAPSERFRLDLFAIPVALVAGLAVVLLAGFTVRSFLVLRSSYCLWTIPGLFALAGCAFAPGLGRRLAIFAPVLAILALTGQGWADVTILSHREVFSHGPANVIERVIQTASDDRPPIIVHDFGPCWAFIYFPIRLEHGPEFEQYLAPESADGPPQSWLLKPLAGATEPTTIADLPKDRRILVLNGSMMGYDEIRREIRGGGVVVPDGPLIEALDHDPAWVVEQSLRFFAYTSVQGRLYAPRAQPAGPPPEPRP